MKCWTMSAGPFVLLAVSSLALAAPDNRVLAAAQAARIDQLQLLKALVNIDSGTGDAIGAHRVEAVLVPRLKALGAKIEIVPAEVPGLGTNLVATFDGTGKARILMIGHIDTVFGPGTVAKRPYRVEGDRGRGPGVSDEKGGVVEGLYALKMLHDLGIRNYGRISFLMESSEERGSPGTRNLIKKLVADSDAELNLEPGDPPDALTVWRKGSATFHIDIQGRAAHAGINPQDGRNAAVELIHQLSGLEAFPHSGAGTTVNLTVMQAGTRNNIIPDSASAQINVRVLDVAEFDRVEGQLRKNAETVLVPDTTVTVSREPAFPPLPINPGTDALAARASAIYSSLGKSLIMTGNGGASESALAASMGIPALDGLGPVGGNFHSDGEYLDLNSLTPRLYLLTMLLMDLSQNPPSAIK
ncbi:MAG: glutamate carboxypeptidase [Rhizomicrobium sp.]